MAFGEQAKVEKLLFIKPISKQRQTKSEVVTFYCYLPLSFCKKKFF